eukprot:scaffold23048_cov63-Phaeocystis_antarctica.AAC.2
MRAPLAPQHPQPHAPFGHCAAASGERSAHGEPALLLAQLGNRRVAVHGRSPSDGQLGQRRRGELQPVVADVALESRDVMLERHDALERVVWQHTLGPHLRR